MVERNIAKLPEPEEALERAKKDSEPLKPSPENKSSSAESMYEISSPRVVAAYESLVEKFRSITLPEGRLSGRPSPRLSPETPWPESPQMSLEETDAVADKIGRQVNDEIKNIFNQHKIGSAKNKRDTDFATPLRFPGRSPEDMANAVRCEASSASPQQLSDVDALKVIK